MRPLALIAFLFAAGVLLAHADLVPAELKDVCSYLKDIESKSQMDCDVLKDPAQWEKLKAEKPALIELTGKRKGEVQKVYEEFSKDSGMKKLSNDSDRSKSSSADTILLTTPMSEPLNERTFPSWYPEDKDLLDVYKRWIAGVNEKLRREKENEATPVSAERRKEIDALLANNKVFIARLGSDINTSEKFRCFIGDDCLNRGDVNDQMQVFTPESRKGVDYQLGADNRPAILRQSAPGGSLQKEMPAPEKSEEKSSGGWKKWATMGGLAAAGLLLGGSGSVDFGKANPFKKDLHKTAEKEVARQQEDFEDQQKARIEGKEEEKTASEAPPPKPYQFTDDYQPNREDMLVINDILDNAKFQSQDDLMKYLTARTNMGGYSKDPTSPLYEAAERISTLVSQGKLTFTAK